MCSRITSSSGSSCIYGDDCVSAHSKDELKEWQNRAQWNKNQSDGNRATLSPAISSSNALSQTPIPKDRIPQAYQSLPKACMYYLVNLVKRVSETSDMSKLFVDSIPDVRIKLVQLIAMISVSLSKDLIVLKLLLFLQVNISTGS
jgi:hypothetical protein